MFKNLSNLSVKENVMKKQDIDAVLNPSKPRNRFVIEFNENQLQQIKELERKTGLSRDMLVFAAFAALLENPNGHLIAAVEEQHQRNLRFIESLKA